MGSAAASLPMSSEYWSPRGEGRWVQPHSTARGGPQPHSTARRGVRGGPQPPGAVQEAARYLRLITNREPTVGACLLIGTGKGERRDYREGSVIGERWGGEVRGSGAGLGYGGAKGEICEGWVWGTAVPKGEAVRVGLGYGGVVLRVLGFPGWHSPDGGGVSDTNFSRLWSTARRPTQPPAGSGHRVRATAAPSQPLPIRAPSKKTPIP